MLDRQLKNNEMVFALSLLSTVVAFNSKQGLFDIHKTLENAIIGILNITYNVSLVNLNIIQHNHPAIDLGDKNEGLAIQVTSDSSKNKVINTDRLMNEHGLFDEYPRLWMVILADRTQTKYRGENDRIIIKNLSDIANDIQNLDSKSFYNVYTFFERELSYYLPGNNASILKPTRIASNNPQQSISNFLIANGINRSDPKEILTERDIRNGLISLKEKLSYLSDDQRYFIFNVMECTLNRNDYHKFNDCKAPVSFINQKAGGNSRVIMDIYDSLHIENIAYYEDCEFVFDDKPGFSVSYRIKETEDMDYLSAINAYLDTYNKKNELESVIVNCNFSLIN